MSQNVTMTGLNYRIGHQPIESVRRVLLIDDDAELRSMLSDYLARYNWQVLTAWNVATGLASVRRMRPEIVILDIMLPDGSGLELLRGLPADPGRRVLLLSARGSDLDRITGLDLGADDYLPKPFNPRELLARMRALVRRNQNIDDSLRVPERLERYGFTVDSIDRRVMFEGCDLGLTEVEFALFQIFMVRTREVLLRDTLSFHALERPYASSDRTIDMHISRLRRKLEACNNAGQIQTVRARGYTFLPTLM
ncbi:MAG: response regulator transcription factor [Acidobacteriota bacterium]|nr:response regulator transcription factor [Acidobacteriota bacterium]